MYDELDDLREIGTPKAAIALVPFLWHEDNNLASRAALNLATLLLKPDVESALRDYSLTKEQRKADWFKWVWEPLNEYEPDGSSLPIITGRIGYIINQLSANEIKKFQKISNLDLRIVIPLAITDQLKWNMILRIIVENTQYPKKEFVRLKNILGRIGISTPTISDWKNIFISSKFAFRNAPNFIKFDRGYIQTTPFGRIIFAVLLLTFFFNGTFSHDLVINFPDIDPFIIKLFWIIVYIFFVLPFLNKRYERFLYKFLISRIIVNIARFAFVLYFFVCTVIGLLNYDFLIKNLKISLSYFYNFLIGILKISPSYFYDFLSTKFLLTTILAILAIFLLYKIVQKIVQRKERKAQNPLHGLIEPPK